MEFIWFTLTLLGTPEMWFLIALLLPLEYVVFRKKYRGEKKARHRQAVLLFSLGVAATVLLSVLLKMTIAASRPCIPCTSPAMSACNPHCPAGLLGLFDKSFPSSHAAAIFAVFTALYLRLRRKKYILMFVVPVMVALSRLYLGVHTPLDILAGAVLGICLPLMIERSELPVKIERKLAKAGLM